MLSSLFILQNFAWAIWAWRLNEFSFKFCGYNSHFFFLFFIPFTHIFFRFVSDWRTSRTSAEDNSTNYINGKQSTIEWIPQTVSFYVFFYYFLFIYFISFLVTSIRPIMIIEIYRYTDKQITQYEEVLST